MFKYLWIALLVFILDQAGKYVAVKHLLGKAEIKVTSFFNLVLVYNSGAAFGFLSDASGWQNMLFIGVALVAVVAILLIARRLGVNETQVIIGLMLILGGAAGNLLDRVLHGYVIDFIDLYYQSWHWPAFNVADSAITVGAVLLVLDALGLGIRQKHGP
jgi:signal peptidase II